MRINLLPWREAERQRRKRAFTGLLFLSVLIGMAIVIAVMLYGGSMLDNQISRNTLLAEENARMDQRIKEISGLNDEINALKARQVAVENLQARRNHSVYLFDELASLVPSGVMLKSVRQTGAIVIAGYAQSNARVSEFLHNLATQAHWLTRPELIEIKSAVYGQGKEARKIFEFSLKLDLLNEPAGQS